MLSLLIRLIKGEIDVITMISLVDNGNILFDKSWRSKKENSDSEVLLNGVRMKTE